MKEEYLYELTYFSIPDYNFIYCCIQHACKSRNIRPTDPLDWDMDHEFAGPCGPPGDGLMVDVKLEEDEDKSDNGKVRREFSQKTSSKICEIIVKERHAQKVRLVSFFDSASRPRMYHES
ncbi:hypothetical protein OESDEN_00584 [Oesophagostomum dentatum]|uniref:Uncharacterized protein n=1 Tax=Oesophagostomum dentatum TaxID=61180 RepID=A0A0B1TTH1_OESDE|nr:hypothetical protein OESDEN_00584 [Oesophagostomum dentatum]